MIFGLRSHTNSLVVVVLILKRSNKGADHWTKGLYLEDAETDSVGKSHVNAALRMRGDRDSHSLSPKAFYQGADSKFHGLIMR